MLRKLVPVWIDPCGDNTRCAASAEGAQCVCKEGFGGNPFKPFGCVKGRLIHRGRCLLGGSGGVNC